jgi:hypothetical protein
LIAHAIGGGNIPMKNLGVIVVFVALLLGAAGMSAQQPAPQAQKIVCRDMSASGNFIAPDETVINGQACRVVSQPAATQQPTAQQQTVQPQTAPPQTVPPATPSAPALTDAPISTKIVPGSTVYIEPMGGFETYLAAAFEKKRVPLVAVANDSQATYVIKGTSEDKKAGWAKIAFTGQIHSDNAASIQVFDKRTGAIVFAYAVDKKNTMHGQQTTAEACAKHLKEEIEKK